MIPKGVMTPGGGERIMPPGHFLNDHIATRVLRFQTFRLDILLATLLYAFEHHTEYEV